MTARLLTALGFVLLVLPFTASSSQADEVQLSVNWVGTVSDTAIDTNGDGLFVDLIDAKASGSFGASLVNVLSEFYFGGFCDQEQKVLYLIILFSRPITTFANSDQLFGDLPDGWMCLNTDTGVFAGEAQGSFAGGTGRFADASGTFTVEFGGTNVTLPDGLPGFGAIRGTMKGTVHLH